MNPDIGKLGKVHQFSSTNQPKNPDGSFKQGRKKGIPSFKTILKKYLKQDFEINKAGGEKIVLTAQDAMVLKAIENAIKYGGKDLELIMNRVDGLPIQAIKDMNKKPLQIVYTEKPLENLKEQDNFETNIDENTTESNESLSNE